MQKQPQRPGFTLIELMIVVGIIAILATVGIVAYSAYVRRSHNAEATSVLADIRIKQEAYRATFHQYVDLSEGDEAGESGWLPNASPISTARQWPDRGDNSWRQLGVKMTGNWVYFAYTGISGAPGAGLAPPYTLVGIDTTNDFWFAAQAVQDLEDNKKCGGFTIGSGQTKMAIIEEESGNCPQ
jgi:prepilin-type N-terminal cleavage/methylation domain-containing protein